LISYFDARRLAVVLGVGLVSAAVPLRAQQDTAARRQQRSLDSLSSALAAMQARLDSLERVTATIGAAPAAPARAAGAYMNIGFDGIVDGGWSTTPHVRALELGDHDPLVRGFTIPNAELTLDANVDPYFKGFTNLVWKLDANGETNVELEEMYVITTSLPWNLQAKVGQYFTEFGRQNPQHPHSWSFVDQPLVLAEMFGPEGLRSQGVRVSWLAPTPFYTEAMVTVANSAGGTAYSFRSDESSAIHGGVALARDVRGFKDMLIVPRLASSIDIGDKQTLVGGVSAAFGPNNSGPDASTQIYGADVYWKWKSLTAAQGFPFWSFQAEAMMRRYEAARRVAEDGTVFPAETLRDQGGYAQVLWGIKPRIVAGLRGDVISGDVARFDPENLDDRFRVSPNFTWYPTEFSKLRLQYNYDHRKNLPNESSLWLQFEFILGAHAAHKF